MEQAEDYKDIPPPAREGQDAETAVWAPMEEYCAECNPNPLPRRATRSSATPRANRNAERAG
eukprot:5363375-Pyramimonas_sp.AAC.1